MSDARSDASSQAEPEIPAVENDFPPMKKNISVNQSGTIDLGQFGRVVRTGGIIIFLLIHSQHHLVSWRPHLMRTV